MKIVLIILGVILVIGVAGFIFASVGLSDIKNMVINEVDLSKVPDGVYTGKFQRARWNYAVEITIKNHEIIEIKNIDDKTDKGSMKLINSAIEAILAKQSLEIDTISGATVNTKAFQKAVENALTEGIN